MVLYEMVTRVQPFRGETSGVIAEAILNRRPVAPVRLNPDLSPKLEEVINKALEKDRKLRYQNAADIRTDLQRLKRDTESGRAAVLAAETGLKPAPKSSWSRWAGVAGAVGNEPIGALAHFGLARAYVLQGDTAKARAAYQDFLTLWKDADPDIPILKQAKAEYAKLQ
jgi:hypothetical protein